MIFVLRELFLTLRAVWQAADLQRHLASWWYVVTHQYLLDSPPETPEVTQC